MAQFIRGIPPPPPVPAPKKCRHQNYYESTIVETVIDKYRPISGSRVPAINNFTIDKKRNIEKRVYECANCGAILKEKPEKEFFTGSTTPHAMEYAADYASQFPNSRSLYGVGRMERNVTGIHNTAIGYNTKSVGSNSIAIGSNAGIGFNNLGIPPTTDRDTSQELILDKQEIEYLLNTEIMAGSENSFFSRDDIQRDLKQIKEMLEREKKEKYRGYSESRRALDDARKQVEQLKAMRDKIVDGYKKEKNKYGYGRSYGNSSSDTLRKILNNANSNINTPPPPQRKKESTIYDYLNLMFKFPFIDVKTVDDKEFYDITFSPSVKMTNDKLDMFENGGQVVEWEKVSKGLFKGNERRIKTMRIEKTILDEWFKNKFSKEKKDEDKLG